MYVIDFVCLSFKCHWIGLLALEGSTNMNLYKQLLDPKIKIWNKDKTFGITFYAFHVCPCTFFLGVVMLPHSPLVKERVPSINQSNQRLDDNKSKCKQVIKKVYKKLSNYKFYVNTKTALRPLQLKWVFAIMYTLVSPLLFALPSWLTKELLEFLWLMVWNFFF